jgi:predicted signal transduction protein with EAL and GGDEF domain
VARPWQPSQQAPGLEILPQLSVGIAITRDPACTADQLLHDADLAMYEAKAAEETPVVVFDASIEQRLQRRIRIRRSLRRCLRQQQIAVHLQPVVHLASGRIQGFEALVRPPAQDDPDISPQEFIAVAEATGLILPLGALLLDACFSITQKLDLHTYSHGLAVNLSTLQLSAAGIADQVLSAAERHGIAPSSLMVEVTETALLEQPQRACDALAQLRAGGCRVLLDDFGTGYSSLTWLAELPIDGLKIDRSFTASMHCDPRRRLMIEAVVNLARQLQLEVVAEGIETSDHHDALLGMGCQFGQGYYFSRPLTVDGLVDLPPVLPAVAAAFPPAAC